MKFVRHAIWYNKLMKPKEFPPITEGDTPLIKDLFDSFTGKKARREQQELGNIKRYAGIVRSINDSTLQLSTLYQGDKAEQNLLAGAYRLAIESNKTVSVTTPQGDLVNISPELATGVISDIFAGFPNEMLGDRLDNGVPNRDALEYCAACVVATLTHDDEDARFYDSIMNGKDMRNRFIGIHSELDKKVQ